MSKAIGMAYLAWLVLAAAPSMQAQDTSKEEKIEKIEDRLADWKQRMNLSPQQVEQIRPIVVEELRKVGAEITVYHDSKQLPRDKLRLARDVRKIKDDVDKQLKPILTGAQMDTLKMIRAETRSDLKDKAGK
jgi:hypothetical protein